LDLLITPRAYALGLHVFSKSQKRTELGTERRTLSKSLTARYVSETFSGDFQLTFQIVQEVDAMVTERLEDWIRLSEKKALPKNILYYRDGVSVTQYAKVKTTELEAIRNAYRKLDEKYSTNTELNITAVVVTKRHHTRFFPMSVLEPYVKGRGMPLPPNYPTDRDSLGNDNTKPGTFVDQLVTSPYYQDFFLQSHSAIKGTAKPTHYFVLEAGIKDMGLERLRNLVCLHNTGFKRLPTC
jgi:eukaryotic translation initiation factor 2C